MGCPALTLATWGLGPLAKSMFSSVKSVPLGEAVSSHVRHVGKDIGGWPLGERPPRWPCEVRLRSAAAQCPPAVPDPSRQGGSGPPPSPFRGSLQVRRRLSPLNIGSPGSVLPKGEPREQRMVYRPVALTTPIDDKRSHFSLLPPHLLVLFLNTHWTVPLGPCVSAAISPKHI